MTRAVIYTRASLDKTGEHESVDRQVTACQAVASARGYQVLKVVQDNSISAYSGKERPGWLEILGMIERREVDVVVAWALDRITRSMVDLEHLIKLVERTGVMLVTANGDMDLTNDHGRLMARVLGAVARAEVERKGERQRLANVTRAHAGKPHTAGCRTFGYAADGETVVEAEAEGLRGAARRVLDGDPLAHVSAWLTEAGLLTTRGKGWQRSSLRAALLNPRYAAIRVYQGAEVGAGEWPAILDHDTHLALKRTLTDPARRMSEHVGNSHTVNNLCSHIAVCSVCDETLRATGIGRGSARYSCRGGHVYPSREVLDRAVTIEIVALLSAPNFADSLTPANDERAARARADLDRARKHLRMINDDLHAGIYEDDDDEYHRNTAIQSAKMKAARAILNESAKIEMFDGIDLGTDKVESQWAEVGLARRREIIKRFLAVQVMPTGSRGRNARKWNAEQDAVIGRRVAPIA